MNELTILACPACKGALSFDAGVDGGSLHCRSCRKWYRRSSIGCWDFLSDNGYDDWFSRDQSVLDEYVGCGVHGEEKGSRRQITEYLVPLLQQLGLRPGATTVLSDGCGIAADIEQLRTMGYQAWGGDPGARSNVWATRSCRPYLVHLNGTQLPFASNSFDFAFSEGVIEHVGQSGDFLDAATDFDRRHLQHERRKYCQELHRVLKPGGYGLLAAPNRWFPIDFFHGGTSYLGVQMRFHSPREPFLATRADINGWFAPGSVRYRALSLKGFFNLSAVASRSLGGKALMTLWNTALTVIPPTLMAGLGPYFVVLVQKRPLPAESTHAAERTRSRTMPPLREEEPAASAH